MSTAKTRPATPVSIVIPVYDRLDLTRQCLTSLWKHTPAGAAEIIVVDNGSTDGTTEEMRELHEEGRITAVLNEENQGFARACNQGAAAASHPYVLFLNNDTEVSEGWLEPLVDTLDLDARVGAAGSLLLFPDGTIQHAGVALIREDRPEGQLFGARHMCYRKPADFPPARKPQLMRCLTAACLLVRRDAFEDVGGFDEEYWNGFEDVDLCLKLDEKGWNLVYRPESVLVHYESQSGEERWAKVRHNVVRLNSRWRDKVQPDYYVDEDDVYTPSPEFSIRTYAPPRLNIGGGAEWNADEPVASVIVLTYNALDTTKLCVDSLLKHTDARHELIFVDNASTDGTVEWLRELCTEHDRCSAIYNDENKGFAAGNNQGIAQASGQYYVLLNSDVVVTEGWLETLVRSAQDHPQAGLIGPVTNSIAGAQKLPRVGYDQETLKDLDLFARMHCEATRGNDELVLWLTGFCLLITRDLVERIGGLDERYGRGNFEDNDYCLRSFLAGYQALIATDCFVHHFGSRSFRAAGVDYDAELEAKWEIFKDKWNVPADVPYGGEIDLERILMDGFDPVLHFHQLPASRLVETIAPAATELDDALIRGEDAFAAGRYGDAETIFRWAHDWNETDSRTVNDLAVTLWHRERSDEALAMLEKQLRHDPDDADAAWNLREIRKAVEEASSPAPDGAVTEEAKPQGTPVA